MSVYKKLHEVQAATRSLAPDSNGQTGAANYKYVSGAKLLGVIRPVMDKLGLILNQEIVGIENMPVTYATRNGEKTEMFTSVHMRFTWVDTEDESKVVNDFFANGMNAWDKGLGSALTYGERYYLMKFFHIATDEDDVDALVKEEAVKTPEATPAATVAPEAQAQDLLAIAVKEAKQAKTQAELTEVWKKYKQFRSEEEFKTAVILNPSNPNKK